MAEKGPMSGSMGRIPGPYINDVKVDDGLMVYPPFPTMDIASRKSGMPSSASTGPKSLSHVGDNDGKSGRERGTERR